MRFGHLEGLSDDQIAYAAQASQGASILFNGRKFEAEIVRENFYNLGKLKVAITSIQPMKTCPGISNDRCVLPVEVKFELKYTYFNNLHQALKQLPEEVVKRLSPSKSDFTLFSRKSISGDLKSSLKLNQCSEDQMSALEVITSSPCDGPPILIAGSFGTGKTLLLATAAQYFFQEKRSEEIRILVCTQQQVSADAFLEYFLKLHDTKSADIVRLTTERGYRRPSLMQWYMNMTEFKAKFRQMNQKAIIIVTTCISALHLAKGSVVPPGYFTHILLDEGAQMREPEAVGALCLARPSTKIVIAGDQNQVSPFCQTYTSSK